MVWSVLALAGTNRSNTGVAVRRGGDIETGVCTTLAEAMVSDAEGATKSVRIDNTAPVTTSNTVASYVNTATITLSPVDPLSGVAYTRWRVDAGSWTTGTVASTTQVGTHTVEWFSADVVGNVESTKTASFEVLARFDDLLGGEDVRHPSQRGPQELLVEVDGTRDVLLNVIVYVRLAVDDQHVIIEMLFQPLR